MYLETSSQSYYENLPRISEFELLADPARYVPLPDDWVIGLADVVGSTHEIARGRYKAVNMVGSAVISAQLNAAGLAKLPYVFGGDGASFAVWPAQRGAAEKALDGVRRWARREFGLELRVAMVTVGDVRAAGQDVRIARYAPSQTGDFAMFSGGGLAWAEERMKSGLLGLAEGPDAKHEPDLTGLSCRWSNMQSRNGAILSLVVKPQSGVSDRAFASVTRDIIALSGQAEREGHPVPRSGPDMQFPPQGLEIEAQAQHGDRAVWWEKTRLFAQNLMIWVLFKTDLRLGQFKPSAYRKGLAQHADFRKFDDGLKMTVDCDLATQAKIESRLRRAADEGLVRFGLHAQEEAMMTCLVPSTAEAEHMHFVDGASGGYARAAERLSA